MKNENWTLNIQFHPFVLKNKELKDKIEKFVEEVIVNEDELQKREDKGYNDGFSDAEKECKVDSDEIYEEGRDDGQREMLRDLKTICCMEQLKKYINDNS